MKDVKEESEKRNKRGDGMIKGLWRANKRMDWVLGWVSVFRGGYQSSGSQMERDWGYRSGTAI